ncbi:Afadin/alpha-actinin-binding [Phaffia rhodozyma]|uniref:Afadin/alpha-actinin-binding n=1 Tax=Phaffia rhodozyma TaxID=264483 RepID=A0A0F7SEI9_PHARH|nr:Afadin/alpha-actinin-binding [Phaffia rhodozyma]
MSPATPSSRKFQQYTFNVVNSPFGKQALTGGHHASFDESMETPTSSMVYINSQLQAHGFSRRPINLSGMEIRDQEILVRCLFSMLHQRSDDLTHFETLSTAHRTLSYDHERLVKMHKQLVEETARAESKEQHAKSLMSGAQQALKDEQTSHKQTKEEAQKARTALAFVRSQAQHDIKKRDAEIARTLERWQKLSNDQAKIMSTRSGLTCLNAPQRPGSVKPSEPSDYFQQTIEEMDDARSRLIAENDAFRRVLIKIAVNVESAITDLSPSQGRTDLTRINPTTFFEPAQPTAYTQVTSHASTAQSKVSHLLLELRDLVDQVKQDGLKVSKAGERSAQQPANGEKVKAMEEELETIRAQLEERQEFLRNFIEQSNAALEAASATTKTSSLSGPSSSSGEERGEGDGGDDLGLIQEELIRQKKELEEERKKFTEAAVKLGQERTEIELERIAFLEEKRALKLEQMLSDLPPTPPQPNFHPPKTTTYATSSPSRSKTYSSSSSSSSPRKPKSSSRSPSKQSSHHHHHTSLARRAVLSSVYSSLPAVSSPLRTGVIMEGSKSNGKGKKEKAVGSEGISSDAVEGRVKSNGDRQREGSNRGESGGGERRRHSVKGLGTPTKKRGEQHRIRTTSSKSQENEKEREQL